MPMSLPRRSHPVANGGSDLSATPRLSHCPRLVPQLGSRAAEGGSGLTATLDAALVVMPRGRPRFELQA